MNTDGEKTCSKCKRSQSRAEFSPNRQNRDGLQSQCRSCRRAYQAAHPEVFRAGQKRFREKYPEKVKEKVRQWCAAHPERVRELDRLRHVRDREKRNAASKLRIKALYQAHPERWRIQAHTRRARILAVGGRFTSAEWRTLKAHYGNKCLRCGRGEPDVLMTPDHVIPLSRGGSNGIENIQPLCWPCNNWKNAKTIDYRPKTADDHHDTGHASNAQPVGETTLMPLFDRTATEETTP